MRQRPVPVDEIGVWIDDGAVRAEALAVRERVAYRLHDHPMVGDARPQVADFVAATNAGLMPELVALRVGRMLASPFAFLRGAAGLMAHDLARRPVTGWRGQICGDAHAANFGLYGGSGGRIVMDLNDFDDTIVGPWEWDLKRLAASLVLAGRVGGVAEDECRDAARAASRHYRSAIERLSELPFLDAWTEIGDEREVSRAKADVLLDEFAAAVAKAQRNTHATLAARWTHQPGTDDWHFEADPPLLLTVSDQVAERVAGSLPAYVATLHESRRGLIARYRVRDVAFRVVGTGSVGLRSYVVLLQGNGDEALVLQVKQAMPSALAAHLDTAPYRHEGERIVRGARLMQTDSDLLMGWTSIDDISFVVRQFRNRKSAIDPIVLGGRDLTAYARLAAALLARAHARSIDCRLLAAYLTDGREFDTRIARYARRYADQTEHDHADLVTAVRAGRLASAVE